MSRTVLTAPTNFYAGTGGSLGNDGLTPATALPIVQNVIDRLFSDYDLDGLLPTINILDGSIDPGFRVSGVMTGQRGFSGLLVRCSSLGAAVIRPSNSGASIAMDSEAELSIAELQMDCAVQAGAGKPQDVIQLGQGARLALWGNNRIIQNSYSYNGITLQNSNMDIFPQSWGSPTQNGGHLYIQGQYQDFLQTDQEACVEANCNGGHGLIEFKTEASVYRAKPYWAVAFADIASGVTVLSGIDFNGVGGDGYRYRIRKGGTLDLNLGQDPGQVSNLPGSASTAWPVQGYLI